MIEKYDDVQNYDSGVKSNYEEVEFNNFELLILDNAYTILTILE